MAVRFTNPFAQWINGNSVVQAGAKLEFYQTGTSTPKNTYSDSDLTTANANPVVADADGQFPNIFLETGEYKVVLKTSAGATLWTADPVGDSLDNVTITGTFAIDGALTPSQITANQNNYDPPGLASATTLRLSTDASREITGLSGTARGRIITIRNVGSFNIVLKDESASSTAANRFSLYADVTLEPDQVVFMQYDQTSARWFAISGPIQSAAGRGIAVSGQTVSLDTTFLPGFIGGLALSNNVSDATNDIDVATGAAVDSTNAYFMKLGTAITKRLDAAWAVGTNQGGLDTGSIADGVYHVWLIARSDTGVVDVLFSTSVSAPTMPTNYNYKRRIGSIIRASAAIKAFTQTGDIFMWGAPVADVAVSNLSTTSTLYALTVPTGVKVEALVAFDFTNASLSQVAIHSPDLGTPTAVQVGQMLALAGITQAATDRILTNTSAQIRGVSQNASTTLNVRTLGYVDSRGR